MKKQKKVLIIISTLTGGGAERVVSNITLNLPEEITADLLLNSVSDNDYPTNANVVTFNMKPTQNKNLFYQLRVFIKRLCKLRKLKKTGGYEACYSFLESANFANIITGKKYCKTIVSVRINLTNSDDKIYKLLVNPMAKILYRFADYVVSLSKGVEYDMLNNFHLKQNRVKTIYNGYDIESINSFASQKVDKSFEEFLKDSSFCYVSVGRHVHQKGHWHLIRAFNQMLKVDSNVKLVLLGKGPLSIYYKQLVDYYGIQNSVYMPGFVNNPFCLMARADVFVFPSLFEGFGNAAVEALACGLPIIASDFRSGAREILAPEKNVNDQLFNGIEVVQYGILTPVMSSVHHEAHVELEQAEACLFEAMRVLRENNALYSELKDSAIERANDFSIKCAIEEWLALI